MIPRPIPDVEADILKLEQELKVIRLELECAKKEKAAHHQASITQSVTSFLLETSKSLVDGKSVVESTSFDHERYSMRREIGIWTPDGRVTIKHIINPSRPMYNSGSY